MSGPVNETPKRTTRPPAGEPAAPPPTPAPKPSPAAATTSQASAAVSNAMNVVLQRLQRGEQLALLGAGLIVLAYILFQLILGHSIVSDFTVLVAVLTILAIWVHRWGHYDFGNGYRIVIGALGVSLGLFAVFNILSRIRFGINADALQLIGLLCFWAGGLIALYGAWMVFRSREA